MKLKRTLRHIRQAINYFYGIERKPVGKLEIARRKRATTEKLRREVTEKILVEAVERAVRG